MLGFQENQSYIADTTIALRKRLIIVVSGLPRNRRLPKNYDSKARQMLYDISKMIFSGPKNCLLRRKALLEVREIADLSVQLKFRCYFPAIIRIAFGNEVFSTPKLISSLKRASFLWFFSNWVLFSIIFILSSKRSITIGMEHKNNV